MFLGDIVYKSRSNDFCVANVLATTAATLACQDARVVAAIALW